MTLFKWRGATAPAVGLSWLAASKVWKRSCPRCAPNSPSWMRPRLKARMGRRNRRLKSEDEMAGACRGLIRIQDFCHGQ